MTNLFFPQWQGVGFPTDMAAGALRLRQHLEADFGLTEWADVALDPSDALPVEKGIIARRAILDQLARARKILADQNAQTVFTVGGDCGIEVTSVGWLNSVHSRDLALVWVDGHADLNTPQTSPSASFHGMPLRVLLAEGDSDMRLLAPDRLAPTQVFMVGVREFDPPELDYVQAKQIPVFHPQRDPGAVSALIEAISAVGFRQVYLHIDLDSLDPTIFPHVPFPAPGGLSVEDVTTLADALRARFKVIGMSLTEYNSASGEGLTTLAPILSRFAALAG
ncbi:MAG: arginase family protein [Anaerolineae bacterium]|jgi:arginase|nr:arginase family protein [Anaerolineae bacterium]